jgi:hypothetical protein
MLKCPQFDLSQDLATIFVDLDRQCHRYLRLKLSSQVGKIGVVKDSHWTEVFPLLFFGFSVPKTLDRLFAVNMLCPEEETRR